MALPITSRRLAQQKLSAGAAAVLALIPLGTTAAFAQTAQTATVQAPVAIGAVDVHSILLFPISNQTKNADFDNVGPLLDDAIRMRLSNVAKFRIQRFSRLLPSIQVALSDKDISSQDIAGPFSTDDDKDRAAKLTARVGSDAYFLGNVDAVTIDPTSHKTTVVVTGNLYDTNTGESIKSFGVSGVGVPESPTDTGAQVLQLSVNDAASQIAGAINAIPVVNPEANRPRQSSHNSAAGSVALTLLVGAVLYAAFHHDNSSGGGSSSSGGGGGGTSGPPPPPGGL